MIFLQVTKDYYDSQIYRAPFNNNTKGQINDWVKKETDGMIPQILEEALPEEAMMYLVNALSFDGKWQSPYYEWQMEDAIFTTESGEKQDAVYMNEEIWSYLQMENATGFIKPYLENQYAFVALLPKEGMSMEDFLKTLDGETLIQTLENQQSVMVKTKLPKFSAEYASAFNDSLKNMGMTDVFDPFISDFSLMAVSSKGNLYISDVIHKTKIDVNEQGTKAGAATVVEVCAEAALETEEPPEPKEVYLDRPFFYMIVDTEQNFPIFMGSLIGLE